MKNIFKNAARLFFLIFLVLMASFTVSCKKEEKVQERKSSQGINPYYSSESAFDEVKKKLQENPKDVDALYHLADLYDRNGQYAEAIDAYKNVVKLKPDMGYAYFKMGTAYDRLDKPEEAVNAFKKAARYMPSYAVLYNNLGIAYGKINRIDDEISALKQAIRLRPSYATARYNLGIAYLKTGNKKAAMKEYEALKEFDEGVAEALLKEIKSSS